MTEFKNIGHGLDIISGIKKANANDTKVCSWGPWDIFLSREAPRFNLCQFRSPGCEKIITPCGTGSKIRLKQITKNKMVLQV